ncbi:ribonucleotide reductase inhibitor-domain-containing protein [Xylaria venustula]|nr:ribonucleotide reductase inhibitor-domain-containing protein [Xylaria venustula]
MSAPRTKRQFAGAATDPAQRQITSFFAPGTNTPSSSSLNDNNNNNNNNNNNYISQTSSIPSIPQRPESAPNLPSSVQSNLLSVGMRIRKSVPEGYKTGNYTSFALWDESDIDPSTKIMGEGQRSRANAFSSPRELLPFCGIHKVGGLDTQPEDRRPISSISTMRAGASAAPFYQPGFNVSGTDADHHDVPGLTSSQESVESNDSDMAPPIAASGTRTRKRFFVEDEGDQNPLQLNLWRFNHDVCSLSPVGSHNGRAMAVPRKGRLRAKLSGTAAAMPGSGQENLMIIDSDFEEAEFLDQGTWEVNMNDA